MLTISRPLPTKALARKQFERSKLLYDRGAIAQKDLEIAESTETKAKVTIKTTLEHLRVLGVDPDHPSPIVEIKAPVSGVISDQQVTNAAGVQGLASPSPFTISDLTHVWIICDVFENDLDNVRLGRARRDPVECLSKSGIDRDYQQHRPGPRSQHPDGQGAY